MIESTPRVVTGLFAFEGRGYREPIALDGLAPYAVPPDRRAQLIYCRSGNSADEMVTLILMRDGTPMRLFPVAARGAMHVPLAVVEDLMPQTRLSVLLAAPEGTNGTIALDLGLVEI